MPNIERACIWVAYLRAFAQCLLEMQGNANHPAAQRLVRQIDFAGVPSSAPCTISSAMMSSPALCTTQYHMFALFLKMSVWRECKHVCIRH